MAKTWIISSFNIHDLNKKIPMYVFFFTQQRPVRSEKFNIFNYLMYATNLNFSFRFPIWLNNLEH